MKKRIRKASNKEKKEDKYRSQGRPAFHPGSTTQGGSDYGQGSIALGKDSLKQGSEKNEGSNYGNEPGTNLDQ